jgi:hypothetical protein
MSATKRVLAMTMLIAGGLLATAGAAPAGVIVSYALGAPTLNQTPVPPTTVGQGATAGNLTETITLQNYETNTHQENITGLKASPASGTFPTSVANAFSKNDTFSFTVNLPTVPPGYRWDLSSLTFNVESGGTANFNSGTPTTWRGTGVESSLTDGTDLLGPNGLIVLGNGTNSPTPFAVTIPLDSLNSAFANFQGGPVTFTFAVFTPNGNDTIDFNDITLNGQVIPEPSSVAAWVLFGAVGGCFLWRQRRSRLAAAV